MYEPRARYFIAALSEKQSINSRILPEAHDELKPAKQDDLSEWDCNTGEVDGFMFTLAMLVF